MAAVLLIVAEENIKKLSITKSFELQEGGKGAHPQELTSVSDWGEGVQPTHLQLEGCRLEG
ncbi:hypothetical protein [Enterobacter sp. CC120223-11]|uniref:hypothetical protein n=1 Tax=Enterobacter sp. CC120223-11 TaxID=1378073 RepID=UPI000BDB7A92|nr:hypothetical protein [Enterobacter sp. CC120223-11]SNY64027.1 hypothetical protein SAMN02744775_01106 [Enterobacter sp. CC120223-11]